MKMRYWFNEFAICSVVTEEIMSVRTGVFSGMGFSELGLRS